MLYTRGPWEVIGSKVCTKGKDSDRKVIAKIESSDNDAFMTRDANATLIAAAPDLLEALKYAYGILSTNKDVSMIAKAIAKAENGR